MEWTRLITVRVPVRLLDDIEAEAHAAGKTRTEVILRALRERSRTPPPDPRSWDWDDALEKAARRLANS